MAVSTLPQQTKPEPLPGIQPYQPPPGIGLADSGPVNSVNQAPNSPTPTPMIPPPPPAAPAAPGTFSADSNLINSQFSAPAPTATAQNTNYGTGAIQERSPIQTNYGTGAIPIGANPQNDAQFQKYTQGFDSALSNISNGPNRTALALQKLQDFDIEGQPALDAGFRKVGQSAAKFGRLGSGMTTNDLTGLQGTYDRNKMLLKNDLARSVAEGDISDRYRTADVYRGARNDQYGFGQDQRNYETGVNQYNQGALFDRQQAGVGQENINRNYGTDVDRYNQGASFDRARAGNSDQANWQDRQYSQGRDAADFQRGERDYQYGLSRDAQNSAIQQRMLEDQLLNSAQGRSLNQLNAGSTDNPTGILSQFAGNQDALAAALYGNAGQLFGNVGNRNQQQPQSQGGGIDYQSIMDLLLKRGQPTASAPSGGSGPWDNLDGLL